MTASVQRAKCDETWYSFKTNRLTKT